jgi:Histidine kinase
VVLLLLAGVVVGHLARLTAEVEAERRHVVQVEAASRERERLARDIHDSVLQVLAMVQRRGAEAGGAAAELGRLAGQQEAALRQLIGGAPVGSPAVSVPADVDLRAPPGAPRVQGGAVGKTERCLLLALVAFLGAPVVFLTVLAAGSALTAFVRLARLSRVAAGAR